MTGEHQRTALQGSPEAPGLGATLAGRYRLDALLGSGAMGSVYAAQDLELQRAVAIKMLLSPTAASAAQRFEREARAIARIEHPNVVQVYDRRFHEGLAFVVLELLRGENLQQRLQRVGALAPAACKQIGLQLCAALEAAHAQGVIHRDLKPANVFLAQLGDDANVVKVLDFGVAKLEEHAELTASGDVFGTLAYLPPELLAGAHAADARSDVYGIGCMLYEMLTGRPPFRASHRAELLQSILHDAPAPLGAFLSDVPHRLASLIERALAKRPSDRFASAAVLRDALREVPDRYGEVLRSVAPLLPAAFAGTDRFVLQGRLGEGGFGTVYEAFDRVGGRRVALKLLRRIGADDIYRFKREFRSVAEVAHPNLVQLEELVNESQHWFFTMELIEGKPLLAYIEGSERRLRHSFFQLAEGLCALHATGRVHRDVKPANVLVEAEGRVVLLDFGLAVRLADVESTQVLGTPAYMAPELERGVIGAAADWYAVGVLLFEALTGQRPPAAPILAEHLGEAPSDLEVLALELLSREPAARPDGTQVIERLRGRDARSPSLGSIAAPAAFIGRERELAVLDAALGHAGDGRAHVVLIEGASGMGKSTLLDRFAQVSLRGTGALCLRGRCHESESLAFRAFDAAIEDLTTALGRMPLEHAASVMPRQPRALVQLFPALKRSRAITGACARASARAGEDPEALRRSAFAALRELLQRLGDEQRIVLLLDDLQWIDRDSVALLSCLLARDEAPGLLVIGCYRKGAHVGAVFSELGQALAHSGVEVQRVVLEPLPSQAAVELARALWSSAESVDDATLSQLAEQSGGNPYFVGQLAHHAMQVADPSSVSLERALHARFASLAADARRVLEVIAVAGRPIARRLALDAAELSDAAALSRLRALHLIRSSGAQRAELVEPYHDRVRQAVLDAMSDAEQRARHRDLARVLEGSAEPDPSALSFHLACGGELDRAALAALHGAERAESSLAFDRAAELYALALSHGAFEGAQRRALTRQRALTLRNAGRVAEAGALLIAAAELAEDDLHASELGRLGGEHLLLSGDLQGGLQALGMALCRFGLRLPESASEAVQMALDVAAELASRPFELRLREASSVPPSDLERTDLCFSLALSLVHVDVRGLPFVLQALAEALSSGEIRRVQRACALFVIGTAGNFPNPLVEPAMRACRELADKILEPYANALVHMAEAEIMHFAGDFLGAERACERAERILLESCVGVSREIGVVRVLAMIIQYSQKGDYRSLASRSFEWLAEAEARADTFQANWLRAAHTLVWVARDEPERARAELLRAERSWAGGAVTFEATVVLFLDVVDRYLDVEHERLLPAQGRSSVLDSPVAQTPLVQGYLSLHRAWSALRFAAAHGGGTHDAERAIAPLRASQLELFRAVGKALDANVSALEGDRERAIRELEDAEQAFRKLHVLALAACTRRRRAELTSGELGARMLSEADTTLRELGIVRPDRFARAYFSPYAVPTGAL